MACSLILVLRTLCSINYFHRSLHIRLCWLPLDLYSLYNVTPALVLIIKCWYLASIILGSYNAHCFEET